MSSTNIILSFATFSIFLSLGIYAAVTAGNNLPIKDQNNLLIACNVICVIQCVYLIGSSIVFPIIFLLRKESDDFNEKSSGISCMFLIYWAVIYYNYPINNAYDSYALLMTILLFTVSAVILSIFIILSIYSCFICSSHEMQSDSTLQI